MNKETENEALASIRDKVSRIEKELSNLGQVIASSIAEQLGARIDGLMGISKREDQIDKFQQQNMDRQYFMENTRLNIFFAIASSVLVSSVFTGTTLLVMAIVTNSLEYWIALAVPGAVIIGALFVLFRFMPESLKYWWRQSKK